MSEPTKTRFTIDLDEIDRQLRRAAETPGPAPRREPEVEAVFESAAFQNEAQDYPVEYPTTPVAPTAVPSGDPLRELARIVGQDDPFQSLLGTPVAGERPVEPLLPWPPETSQYQSEVPYTEGLSTEIPVLGKSHEVGNLSDYLRPDATRAPVEPPVSSYEPFSPYSRQELPSAAEFVALENLAGQGGPSGAFPGYTQYQEVQSESTGYVAEPQAYQQPHVGATSSAPHVQGQNFEEYTPSYANPSLGYQPGYHPEEEIGDAADASQRKKWLLRGGIAIVAVGIAAGAYGFMKSKGIVGSGEPPVVVASDGPIKVAPTEPDGKEFPDQNKQIYQSGAKEGRTQIVNREEQPVDVKQATGASANALTDANSLGEARKVKTIIVTANGKPFTGEGEGSAASPSTSSQAPQRPQPYVPATGGVSSPRPTPPAISAPSAGASTASPPNGVQASQPGATPTPPPVPTRPRVTQQPAATPTAAPSTTPQRTAAATPSALTTAATAQRAPGGPFVVQFGTAGSEAEGKAKFARMKSQYSAALNGVSASVYSGTTSANSTIYRIRSGGMSKEAADTLCNNVKAAANAQACFVVKN